MSRKRAFLRPTSVTPDAAPRLRLIPGSAAPADASQSGDSGPDDERLVARALRSDLLAFELLYRRHAGFALNLAVRIQGSANDAEDIVHDAFLKASERLSELREASAFRPWLGSIVVRLVRTRLRRQRLLRSLGLVSAEPIELDAIASPHADPESRVLLAQVYSLLQTLPADERIAWTLRYVDHHRLEIVAKLVDCSLATAKRRILRAQRFLSEHFVPAFAEGES
ncbi:MAG TPA: sigma-70 family RNA polymerase sigma factor [Polyangiaceae bacterium]|nr:sigma-70 family RNA polymerase sigma factor [Polyangiaceae bacterium]